MPAGISYLNIIATACATTCFVIAGMHFFMWARRTNRIEYLLSTTMAVSAGVLAFVELRQAFVEDIESYVVMSRVTHIVLLVLLMSLVTFVHTYLSAGPRWLIWTIGLFWSAAVIQSFVLPYGVVHAEITALTKESTFWGEQFTVATGPVNPGKYVADLAVVLILIFLGLAGWQAGQRGQTNRALLVSGSGLAFVLVSVILSNLGDLGLAQIPFIAAPTFLIVVAVLTYMILHDAFRANAAALEVAQLRRVLTLGEMVGGLAHEINQPLAAILSNAQAARRFLASESVDLEEIGEIVEDIIADDKRASEIVKGLRTMLRRDTAGNSSADLAAATRAAIALVRGECHAHSVSLDVELDPALGFVRANEIEIEQVFVNLLLNGIRAAAAVPRNQRDVRVRCDARDGIAYCTVADSGPGIREDVRKSLFEPFVSTSGDGLGLGLSVCKRIVERAGGRIWAEDGAGRGASFTFTLPLMAEQVSA
jgi:signal transduction histidine kinase